MCCWMLVVDADDQASPLPPLAPPTPAPFPPSLLAHFRPSSRARPAKYKAHACMVSRLFMFRSPSASVRSSTLLLFVVATSQNVCGACGTNPSPSPPLGGRLVCAFVKIPLFRFILHSMLTSSPMSASSGTSGGGAMCIRVQTRAVSSLYTQVTPPAPPSPPLPDGRSTQLGRIRMKISCVAISWQSANLFVLRRSTTNSIYYKLQLRARPPLDYEWSSRFVSSCVFSSHSNSRTVYSRCPLLPNQVRLTSRIRIRLRGVKTHCTTMISY